MRKGVQKIYSEVAQTYELVNHILTFGFDIRWRKAAARQAVKLGGGKFLDVCCGTGELSMYLSEILDQNTLINAVDFSYPMLKKAKARNNMSRVSLTLAEADKLPYGDNIFDLVIISFATRNLNPRKEILRSNLMEFYRVLNRGGAFINVETSQPLSPLLRKLFHFYIKTFVQPVGSLISGSKPGYRYLAHTIPRFYSADELSTILNSIGFYRVTERQLLGGIACIHEAVK
ncbi:MAG: ubiquinone/menaquinone biosynthesis methyltransferase [Candidatus Aminicenantes bacterium]|jgi:demethylmenaquinone methyltransferase/2-methoxy-6-polyprenyl-1,4-benzoquinol methylase